MIMIQNSFGQESAVLNGMLRLFCLLVQDLGFSASDRAESVRRVGELSCLFNDAGTVTIVSLVSPYREDRDIARKRHEEQVSARGSQDAVHLPIR